MKIGKKSQSFDPCPEYTGQAVCVDVTPLKQMQTAFGPKEVFRLVFETASPRADGTRYCVWSRPFAPSLHEKATLTQFLRKWYGRPLTTAEESEFETELLVGRPAEIVVAHEQGKNGETYANIVLIKGDRSAKPLTPSGKLVRAKDRETKGANGDAEYRRTDADGEHSDADWRQTRVHVGRCNGLTLGDLDRPAVQALIDKWIPTAKAQPKLSADDRRLIVALEAAKVEIEKPVPVVEEDDIPF